MYQSNAFFDIGIEGSAIMTDGLHTLFSNAPLPQTHETDYWHDKAHVDAYGGVWQPSPVPSHKGAWRLVDEPFAWPKQQALIEIEWLGLPLFDESLATKK